MIAKTVLQRSAAATPARRAIYSVRAASTWAHVPQGPPDAILGITEAFKKDAEPKKISKRSSRT
jgi:aspartate aminotransferase, mitochondrial